MQPNSMLVLQDGLSISITLQTSFLKWVHGHRLVDGTKSKRYWKDEPTEHQFNFGGIGGCQFSTKDQVDTFIEAFNATLERYEIDRKHRYALWYIVLFLHDGPKLHRTLQINFITHIFEQMQSRTHLITNRLTNCVLCCKTVI